MADALLRHWELLRAIPRAPAKRDVASLHQVLKDRGYEITRRQLQRDLNSLSGLFPLICDNKPPAYGWSWSRDSLPMDLPVMDPQTALVLKLVEKFIPQLLPPVLNEHLRPYYRKADELLKSTKDTGLARWSDNVRVVPREMPLLPPKFDEEATRVVYDALLQGHRLKAKYASRTAGAQKEYEINPLGLVVRGSLIYLVCTLWTYQDVRHLAVHRLSEAQLLDKKVKRPAGFNLDDHISQGEFQYLAGPPIKLVAVFEKAAAFHLAETPLSADQTLRDLDKDKVEITATVHDSDQLVWWLRGFGDSVEILAPEGLRSSMDDTSKRTAKVYKRQIRRNPEASL